MIAVVVAVLLGAFLGSFLNVCIHRMPRNESVVHPPSRCYACGTRVAWYDNLPVVSYLVLRGRCRWCGSPFSPRYLVLELVSAALTGAVVWATIAGGVPHLAASPWWGGAPVAQALTAACLLVLAWYLLVASVIDLEHEMIPDELSKPMQALAPFLAAAAGTVFDLGWHPLRWAFGDAWSGPGDFLSPFLWISSFAVLALVASGSLLVKVLKSFPGEGEGQVSPEESRGLLVGIWWFAAVSAVQIAFTAGLLLSGVGALVEFGLLLGSAVLGSLAGWWILYLVGLVGTVLARQYAMGFGDVKLLAPMGAFLGPVGVVYTVFVSSVIGTVVGLPSLWRKWVLRREYVNTRLPYGPFLAVAALMVLGLGANLHRWIWDGMAWFQGLYLPR